MTSEKSRGRGGEATAGGLHRDEVVRSWRGIEGGVLRTELVGWFGEDFH